MRQSQIPATGAVGAPGMSMLHLHQCFTFKIEHQQNQQKQSPVIEQMLTALAGVSGLIVYNDFNEREVMWSSSHSFIQRKDDIQKSLQSFELWWLAHHMAQKRSD